MGRRYFAASEFGDGLRKPMNRDERGIWLARLDGDLRAGDIEPWYLRLGQAMARELRPDGCLTPSLARLARVVGCSVRTIQRGLQRLRQHRPDHLGAAPVPGRGRRAASHE